MKPEPPLKAGELRIHHTAHWTDLFCEDVYQLETEITKFRAFGQFSDKCATINPKAIEPKKAKSVYKPRREALKSILTRNRAIVG